MGVSPWNKESMLRCQSRRDGRNDQAATPVAPSKLRVSFDLPGYGFAPLATACRPFGTQEPVPSRYVGVDKQKKPLGTTHITPKCSSR